VTIPRGFGLRGSINPYGIKTYEKRMGQHLVVTRAYSLTPETPVDTPCPLTIFITGGLK